MRKYLHEKKRVFVNNIIATLRFNCIKLYDANDNQITIDANGNYKNDKCTVYPAKVEISNASNVIGIIDGQHRIYAYHEGNDKYEEKIAELRKVQNLLVSAILYPNSWSDEERLKFEAQLFLEINATQQNASSNLTQTIENILKPDSSTAIAKHIISKLNESGPLLGLFEEHWYEKDKIKTVSVISFGLKPLIKTKGNDSLFTLWDNLEKNKILQEDTCSTELLSEYKTFCVEKIRDIMIGFKENIPPEMWHMSKRNTPGILNVTTINGIINCLRYLIENGKVGTIESYKEGFKGIDKFEFKSFKSSQYRPMGKAIYEEFFNKK